MTKQELCTGINLELTDDEYNNYNRLYLLLDLDKAIFYKVAKVIGTDEMTGAFGNVRIPFLYEADERERARRSLIKCEARLMELRAEMDEVASQIPALRSRIK